MPTDKAGDEDFVKGAPGRGVALVATPARWLATTSALVGAMVAALWFCLSLLHSHRTLASFLPVCAIGAALLGAMLWLTLRAEELRLGRELRTARTGTAALRSAIVGRRRQGSPLARLLSTHLGTAAILLAQKEGRDARDALGRRALLMEGGRLDALRVLVAADADRDSGSAGALEQCIRRLRATPRIGNREADLYRSHVLAKSVLERGDPACADEVLSELALSGDDEERVYATWLRVWFASVEGEEHDAGQPLSDLTDGDLRIAMLLARAHGADQLVDKLGRRLAAIAPPVEGE